MKETKQQRYLNQLLSLYGKKPSLQDFTLKKVSIARHAAAPEFFMQTGAITKNLLQSVIIASLLMAVQYAVGRIL